MIIEVLCRHVAFLKTLAEVAKDLDIPLETKYFSPITRANTRFFYQSDAPKAASVPFQVRSSSAGLEIRPSGRTLPPEKC